MRLAAAALLLCPTLALAQGFQVEESSIESTQRAIQRGETTCREVISRDIGAWLISEDHAPWPEGAPPRFKVRSLGGSEFEITGPA